MGKIAHEAAEKLSYYRGLCKEVPVPSVLEKEFLNEATPRSDLLEFDELKTTDRCDAQLEKMHTTIQPQCETLEPYLANLTKAKVRAVVLGPPCSGKSRLIQNILE